MTGVCVRDCFSLSKACCSVCDHFHAMPYLVSFLGGSGEWLSRFKSRHNVTKRVYEGKAASANNTAVISGREELKKVMKNYEREDIFKMDETGLFFKLGPNYTLASKPVKGVKRSKERITVALCANATWETKIKQLVIAKARRPRCFGTDFNPEVYVRYKHNKRAWMTSELFCDWLRAFDRQTKSRGRHVILLVDNAASHGCTHVRLTNVKVHFLPPNTTKHIQPMDGRIIRTFKAYYQRYLVQLYLNCVEENEPQVVSIRQALRFVKQAWGEVKLLQSR
ncbi:tigger transposable element-derived protein 6-like [Gigantopelta aegis]|uniref:tigger transposable element-derived protein 6-like n=1 Tax=Gigantopelta aegis TaxID=1735272 RepID=UPI001B88C550|nr:tigger transposable element-derived protein 6-like [Gigantopelta aegis]